MKQIPTRIFTLVALVCLSLFYVIPWTAFGLDIPFSGKEYKLWLDLQWWVELDYKVDLEEAKKEPDYNKQKENDIVEWLKRIIDKRVQSLNINDSVISSANYWSEKHIVVQIPLKGKTREENDANIARAKDAIGKVVKIEFREARLEVTPEDLEVREVLAQNSLEELQESEYDFFVTANKIRDNNDKIQSGVMTGTTDSLSQYFSYTWNGNGLINEVLTGTGKSEYDFLIWDLIPQTGDAGFWVIEDISKEEDDFFTLNYLFVSWQPSEWMPAIDTKWRILNDKYFLKSSVQYTEAGTPLVELTFNDEWAEIFWELTARLVNQPIAIFVWWELLTSPNVNEPILNGRAVITGQYSIEEASALANDINTWVVPAAIYLTSERSIDSKLWANSLQKLFTAWALGFILIYAFLIYVYRWSWVLAGLALLIYVILILGIVKVFGTILTLASIAWLILSLGMAIDANILIFERIRDELKRNSKLPSAIQRWFDSSWSAIWDSNITWLIVSLILYIFWINIIKWFGLMLGIGIVVSLFSAMFVSRLFIILLSHKKNLNNTQFIGLK